MTVVPPVDGTFGAPRVLGKWGNPHRIIMEPSFILTEKGGMQSGGLEQWIEQQIIPAYPNLAFNWRFDEAGNVLEGPVFLQLDAGPDRLTDSSLPFRQRMWEKGLILFPGLPNGTAGNQARPPLTLALPSPDPHTRALTRTLSLTCHRP